MGLQIMNINMGWFYKKSLNLWFFYYHLQDSFWNKILGKFYIDGLV